MNEVLESLLIKIGLEEDLDIECEADVVNVMNIHLQAVVPGKRIASVSRSVAGNAWFHQELFALVALVELSLSLEVGTRAYDTHVSNQDIEELREFIKTRAAHERTDLRHAGVVCAVVGAAVSHGKVGGVDLHGAEFVHDELFAVLADARGVVKNGTLVFKVDDRSKDGGQQKQKGHYQNGNNQIEAAFEEVNVH